MLNYYLYNIRNKSVELFMDDGAEFKKCLISKFIPLGKVGVDLEARVLMLELIVASFGYTYGETTLTEEVLYEELSKSCSL